MCSSCSACMGAPKAAATCVLRICFGLAILLMGIIHYMDLTNFLPYMQSGLGALTWLGTLWAYVYPALLILGGALLVLHIMDTVAVWATSLAFGSLVVGLMLKSLIGAVSLSVTLPGVVNALIFYMAFFWIVKGMSCCCHNGMQKMQA